MNPFKINTTADWAFCNRTEEVDYLYKNMILGRHTVVYAPRRYGKSGMAHAILKKLAGEAMGIYVDLSAVTSCEYLAEKLYLCIVQSFGKTAPDISSVVSNLMSAFKNMHLTMSFNPVSKAPGIDVSLGHLSPELHIETIVGALDEYCEKQQIKVCLVLDEFQEILGLKEFEKIEELLCSGMQNAKNISFMFLGSRQALLMDIFENKKRPFYKKTQTYVLSKIPEADMESFLIGMFAKEGIALAPEEAKDMVAFCNCHPYYTNKLGWLYFQMKAEGESLGEAKKHLVSMESADFENIFANLTTHQKRLLQAIAQSELATVFSQKFLVDYRLGSQGGVQNSLAKLKSLDLVEQQEGKWRVVDPIFSQWMRF